MIVEEKKRKEEKVKDWKEKALHGEFVQLTKTLGRCPGDGIGKGP